jgi:hypothetical protein
MTNNKQSIVEMMWDEIDNLFPFKDSVEAQKFCAILDKYKAMHKKVTMSNNKQSSVGWMIDEYKEFDSGTSLFLSKDAINEHAREMHRDEIMDAVDWGNYKGYEEHKRTCIHDEDEKYYNSRFVCNNEQ